MEENKNGAKKTQKLTYDELKEKFGELYQQYQRLATDYQKLAAQNQQLSFDRDAFFLTMLFKVLEHPEMYSSEFVAYAVKNVEDALTSFGNAVVEEKKEGTEKPDEAE